MNQQEMRNLMEFLCSHRMRSLPPSALADVFDRLIWCLDDNGEALGKVRESWLTSNDRELVEIALAMNEVFPFADGSEMNQVLARVAKTWPDLAARCDQLREERARAEQSKQR
jgi:hypothetical protein